MSTSVSDVIAPRSFIIPNRTSHTVSGANGTLTVSGSELYMFDATAGNWLHISSGAIAL